MSDEEHDKGDVEAQPEEAGASEGGEEEEGVGTFGPKLHLPVAEGHHRLESAWTLWYDVKPAKTKTQSAENWCENLVDLGSFNTIEGFWSIYSHIARPSTLPKDSNYWLFRDHVLPAWESFPNGGCWILKVGKSSPILDRMWEELVLGAIGEAFEEPDVVGVALAIRKNENRISVWHGNQGDKGIRMKIGEHLKSILTLGVGQNVEYKNNQSSMKDGSTFRNTKTYQFVVTKGDKGKGGKPAAADEGAPAGEEKEAQEEAA